MCVVWGRECVSEMFTFSVSQRSRRFTTIRSTFCCCLQQRLVQVKLFCFYLVSRFPIFLTFFTFRHSHLSRCTSWITALIESHRAREHGWNCDTKCIELFLLLVLPIPLSLSLLIVTVTLALAFGKDGNDDDAQHHTFCCVCMLVSVFVWISLLVRNSKKLYLLHERTCTRMHL